MPSIKPKIQGYVQPEIFQAFEQWKAEQGIEGVSEALNELFKQFFGFEKPLPTVGGLSKEEAESLIEEKLAALQIWAKFAEERIQYLEKVIQPIEGLAEISQPLEAAEVFEEFLEDSLQSPSVAPERVWQIGDRVRVLCKSSYQGRVGTIIGFDQRLGWHVAVDRWWEAVGVAESVIDKEQKKAGNIWCDPKDMELMQEPKEETPLSSLEQEDLEANPLTPPPQSLLEESGVEEESPPSSLEQEDNDCSRYSEENLPQKGDRLSRGVSLGSRRGKIIEIHTGSAPYEVLWEARSVSNLYSLEDLESMSCCVYERRKVIPPQSPVPLEGLKQSELERRLEISKGTLIKRRNRDDFKEWSRGHDPNGVAWQWDAIARKYLAVE